MTGDEHYAAAELFLEYARENESGSEAERYNVAVAQVHATLAAAAATAHVMGRREGKYGEPVSVSPW